MVETDTNSVWFPYRKPRPQPTLRLFCFPAAGRGASAFRRWQDLLPEHVEVWPVQLPGREGRLQEPSFTRLEPLVTAVCNAMLPVLDLPFAFFGHSMGALVAFEVARRLRLNCDLAPIHLFICGYSAPKRPRLFPSIANSSNQSLQNFLRRISGTPDDLLTSNEVLEVMSPILQSDFEACDTYRYLPLHPLQCSLTAYGGLQDEFVPWYGLDSWSEETSGQFRVRFFSGGHFVPQTDMHTFLSCFASDLALSDQKRGNNLLPQGREVHISRIRLDQSTEVVRELFQTLSSDERDRAARFIRDQDRNKYVIARAAVRSILGRYTNVFPSECQFSYGQYGKPFLREPRETSLEFNLSHSGSIALMVVACGRQVGIDLEQVQPDIDLTGISKMVFDERELKVLAAQSLENQLPAFYELWTRKEAVLKCHGVGFADSEDALTRVRVPLPKWARANGMYDGRIVASIRPDPSYMGAVAIEGGFTSMKCSDWAHV